MIVSPKKAAFLCILPILLGGTIAWGVKTIISSEADSIEMKEVSAVEPPLKLVMRLNKTEYQPGDSITVEMKLVNIGNSTVTVWFCNRGLSVWLRFEIYNASDDLVFKPFVGAWSAETIVFLDPNGFIGYTHGGQDDISYPLILDHQLKPGTYRIIGFLNSNARLDSYQGSEIALETPPIEITIG